MSNKLAKVLLICALVVCIPLLVAGTVLAVYFSTNASVNVAVYVNNIGAQYGDLKNPIITSSGKVTNNLDDEDAKYDVYTITNSHIKDVNIAFQTTGYNFVGWYNGNYDAYVKALADSTEEAPVEYLSLDKILTIKTADYQDLTAVFEVKTFTVSYSYDSDPDNADSGEETTTVPVGGSSSFEYGQPLPILENTYKNQFMGWTVNGGEKIYNSAVFDDIEGEIVLTAVWKEYPEFSYSIEYDYTNYNASLGEGEEPVPGSIVKIESKLDEIQLPSLDSYQREGKRAYWGDANGNEITSITNELLTANSETKIITLKVYYEDLSYSINITVPVDVSYVGEVNSNVKYSDLDNYLTETFKAVNWSHNKYKNTWGFKGLKYNDVLYTNTTEDLNKLKEAIVSADTAVTLEGVVECVYTSFVVNGTLDTDVYGNNAFSESGEIVPTEAGYTVNINEDIYYYASEGVTGLFGIFDLKNETFYTEDHKVVTPVYFSFTYSNNKIMQYTFEDFNDDASIYNLIEKIVTDNGHGLDGTEFVISDLTIHFEEVEQ